MEVDETPDIIKDDLEGYYILDGEEIHESLIDFLLSYKEEQRKVLY